MVYGAMITIFSMRPVVEDAYIMIAIAIADFFTQTIPLILTGHG